MPAVPPFRSLRSGAGAIRTQAAHLSLGWTSWPFRSFAEWSGALEFKYLRDSGLRRVVKALVDFWCGALSVVAAVAVAEGFAGLRVGETARLAAVVGGFLVWTEVLTGRYRTMWRYMDLREAAVIATRSLVVLAGLLIARWAAQAPVSGATVLLTVLLTLSFRIGVRALRGWQLAELKRRAKPPQQGLAVQSAHRTLPAAHRILIAGAGERGLSISRDLAQSRLPGVELVGFADDDPAKMGACINGLPVLGPLSEVLAIAERFHVTEILVAMPSSDPVVVRALIRRVEDSGLRVRALQGVERFVKGQDLHRSGSTTLYELLGDGAGPKPQRTSGENGARRVLITGGAGYVGSHLTRMLLERGHHVRVLDRFDYGRSGLAGVQHPRLEVVPGDICSSRDLGQAMHRVDAVVALAAIVGDPACALDPEETINLNYTATKMLIDACNFYSVRRLVFASSCSVYGANGHALLTEQSRLKPVSLYARTRVLSENVIFDRRGDVEAVALRLSTVFGLSPRMRFDLVVNTLTAQAVIDKRISIFGGNQWRPNVHCRDAARAFVLALEAPSAAIAGELFNVGGDSLNHRIHDIGTMVAEIVGGVEVHANGDVADPRDYRVSFEKIRRVLGFEPEFSVADGIRELAAAVRREHALQRYRDPVYHNVQALQERLKRDVRAPALREA